mgnify:CR=1 FL=1
MTILKTFSDTVKQYPSKVAVMYSGGEFTFQEVDVWLFIRFKLNSLQVAQFIVFDDCINSWCIKDLEVILAFIQTCQHLCNIFICVVKFNWLV